MKVFYNRDCQKYGILCDNKQVLLISKKLYKKTGHNDKRVKCYTKYEKVAYRWFNDVNNDKLVIFSY